MKRQLYWGILFLLMSCNSLDLNPLSEGSSENWYTDETEVEMAVSYLFTGDRFYQYDIIGGDYTDRHSDDWSGRTETTDITGGTLNSQTSFVGLLWERAYDCIAASNRILLNIERSRGAVSDEKLDYYAANAKFSRANKYAYLIFRFGDVPYYDGVLSIDEAFSMGRISKEEILTRIYADYDFAIEHLPVQYGSNENKFATKGAALAMKARVALYMHDFKTAKEAAKACIDLDTYQLLDNYSDLYIIPNSRESIFCFPRSTTLGTQLGGTRGIVSRTSGGFGSWNPSWDLLLSYLCTDGLTIDKSPLFDPRNPFKNRDPRCSETIVPFGSYWLGYGFQPHPDTLTVLNLNTGQMVSNQDNRAVVEWSSFNGLIWKKKVDLKLLTTGIDYDNIIIRYADVLLMYAEAKIELNEIDQSVLEAMNQVRSRAYGVRYEDIDSYPTIKEMSQEELRKILRIERRMEFAFEGLRYPDLVRWRLAEKALNKPIYGMLDVEELQENVIKKGLWFFGETPRIDADGLPDLSELASKRLIKQLVPRKFDASKQYLWPIPASEIIINPNIKQNSGY